MQYAYMTIHVHIEDDIVELMDKDKDGASTPGDGCIGAQNFKIRAKHLGITTLYVSQFILLPLSFMFLFPMDSLRYLYQEFG